MILFIDTEWADALASELVSLALVSECGRHEFYAERDPLPVKATDLVRSVVYPLLDRGPRQQIFLPSLPIVAIECRGEILPTTT